MIQTEVVMARPITRIVVAAAFGLIASSPAMSRPPDTWDGLMKVNAKAMQAAYLLPNADFRPYTKVLLQPAEIAFAKDWQRTFNSSASFGGRISDADVRDALDKGATRTNKIFSDAFSKAGYQVVAAPGPDVISIKPMIVNIRVAAPDVMTAGPSYSFSYDAGQATLGLEVRDSLSHQLLGMAADAQIAGDNGAAMRTSASNWSDFEDLVKTWARQSATGLGKLKELSPIDANGNLHR
jgi:hypothetical protein